MFAILWLRPAQAAVFGKSISLAKLYWFGLRSAMTIIDFHTHFFPESLYRAIWKWFDDYLWGIQHKVFADELFQKLKSMGISKMVLLNYAHKPGMSQMLNQWTREFADKYPEIIPFGTVHPHDEYQTRL
jgi:hypothetical protein